MTCMDQTFYMPFLARGDSVNMYMINFKKGQQISKDKFLRENKESLDLLRVLPSSADRTDQVIDL
jgi:hypothetical protein